MVLPRLIHPVPVSIERISKATTPMDAEFAEPIGAARRLAPVTVQGQPKWMAEQEIDVDGSGAKVKTRGYVLFRYVDLSAASVVLQLNDRLLSQGFIAGSWYIVKLEPVAHYPDQGGATMVKAWISDRAPAKTP